MKNGFLGEFLTKNERFPLENWNFLFNNALFRARIENDKFSVDDESFLIYHFKIYNNGNLLFFRIAQRVFMTLCYSIMILVI